MVVFTRRELERAWRNSSNAWDNVPSDIITNSHRLLLFYAVETGLKAVYLRRQSMATTELATELFKEVQHNLNAIMDKLMVGQHLKLPKNIQLNPIQSPSRQRDASVGDINQIWRYGASAKNPIDSVLEKKLIDINEWIRGELA